MALSGVKDNTSTYRGHIVWLLEVISNGRSLVLFNSLVKMSARMADIPCITQVTLKIIHNALLIHKGWLVFPHFDLILDFPTRVDGANVYIDLPAEVRYYVKVSKYYEKQLNHYKGQHKTDMATSKWCRKKKEQYLPPSLERQET